MEFEQKAGIILERWITHNEQHGDEYKRFADQLEEAGKVKSAGYVREMAEFNSIGTASLKKALEELFASPASSGSKKP